jgi:CheY-like chemotaxis protein
MTILAAPCVKESKTVTDSVTSDGDLNGLRILVVEDEAAISLLLEDMLLDFGCEVIGPAARLSAALDAVAREQVDLAILDVNVAGEPIYPVAEALAQRSIPFVFSTGYGSAGIRDAFRDRPVLQKPFAQHDLKQKLIMARGTKTARIRLFFPKHEGLHLCHLGHKIYAVLQNTASRT